MLKTTAATVLLFLTTHSLVAQQAKDSINIKKISLLKGAEKPVFKLSSAIPANYAVQHLPFFCDKESRLEKWTKIPFRFRLGSVEYCDKMEGKHQ